MKAGCRPTVILSLMSHEIFSAVFPFFDNGEKVCFILIDNFRLDQWKVVQPLLLGMV